MLEDAFEYVVTNMAATLSQPQCVEQRDDAGFFL